MFAVAETGRPYAFCAPRGSCIRVLGKTVVHKSVPDKPLAPENSFCGGR